MKRAPRGICWQLAGTFAHLLDVRDRAVILGDLVETGARGNRALMEVAGLVIRRQAALWLDWRPWLALATLAFPIGMLLSHASRWLADGAAFYASLYLNDSFWLFVDNPGSRRHMMLLGVGFLLNGLALAGWSWTCGFALGRLSRRAVWVTGGLFSTVVLLGTFGTVTMARIANPQIFSSAFYDVVFPRLLRLCLVLFPAAWGMYRSVRQPVLPLRTTAVGALAVVVLTVWSAEIPGRTLLLGRGLLPANPGLDGNIGTADDWQRLLSISALLWPAAYIVVTRARFRSVPGAAACARRSRPQ